MFNSDPGFLINQLPVAIYCKDREGIYIFVNAHAKQLVENNGYNGDLLGKKDIDIFPKSLAEQFRNHDIKVMATGQQISEEEEVLVNNDPSGQIHHQISIKQPLKDEAGNVTGILGMTLNVNSIKNQKIVSGVAKPSVLLIEDSLLVQKVMAVNLSDWGYGEIHGVNSIVDAVKKTAQKKYDFIFLDLGLPDIKEWLVGLRKNEISLNQTTPIIALTEMYDADAHPIFLAKGINQIVAKPLQENEAKNILTIYHAKVNELPIVDWALWRKRCGNHEDLVHQAYMITMKQLVEFKDKSSAALVKKDFPTVGEVAHKCCGGLKYCGFPRLEAAAIALNKAVSSKDFTHLAKLHSAFIIEIDAALQVKYKEP